MSSQIEGITGPSPRKGGASRARVKCATCGREEVVPCDYVVDRHRSTSSPVIGQVMRRMTAQKWEVLKGRLICPACAAKRRAGMAPISKEKDSENMATKSVKKAASDAAVEAAKTPLRQPTQEQRGDIIEMLVTCYDRKAKRYSGSETDKTVAEAIGGGCMPGWVAEIRERDFGPSGGNEEIEGIRTDIAALTADVEAKIAALTGRLDRVCAAVGPRAR